MQNSRATIIIILVVIIAIIIFRYIQYFWPLFLYKKIPRVTDNGEKNNQMRLYRTWKSRYIDERMLERCHQKWLDLNKSIRIEWFDDRDCREYMKTQPFKIQNAYNILKPTAFKADLWRLCLLYENGGMYADGQTMPYVSTEEMLKGCYDDKNKHIFISVLDCELSKSGIHNGFMYCTAKHPFVLKCIERIVKNVESRDYTDHSLAVTGPICLRRAVNDVLQRPEDTLFTEGYNDFGDLSLYLYKYNWGPSQYIYKDGKKIMCKKHCLLTTLIAKLKSSAYKNMWNKRDIYK